MDLLNNVERVEPPSQELVDGIIDKMIDCNATFAVPTHSRINPTINSLVALEILTVPQKSTTPLKINLITCYTIETYL